MTHTSSLEAARHGSWESALSSPKATGTTRAMALFILIATVYWMWIGLTLRAPNEDDGISILAAQSILEHGYSRLPSGYLYNRGHPAHYAVAGAIQLFGANQLSIMLSSVILGLGSLWFVYLISKEILRQPLVGLATSFVLVALSIETFYATGPRFYMAVQFFTLLSLYSAWRGYVRGSTVFQAVTLVAIALALLTHVVSVTLLVAIPLATIAAARMTNSKWPKLHVPLNLAGAAVIGLSLFLSFGYVDSAGVMPAVAAHGGEPPEYIHSRLSQILAPSQLPLYGLAGIPILLSAGASLALHRRGESAAGPVYMMAVVGVCALALAAFVKFEPRFWFFIAPAYALLVATSVTILLEPMRRSAWAWLGSNRRRRTRFIAVASLAAVGAVSLGATLMHAGIADDLKNVFGLPCLDWECYADIRSEYAAVSRSIAPEDLVVTNDPFGAHHYLGKVDGFLRRTSKESGVPRDEYFGVPMVYTTSHLTALLEQEARVWVIVDGRIKRESNQEIHRFLEEQFVVLHRSKHLTAYVNCAEPPCSQSLGE